MTKTMLPSAPEIRDTCIALHLQRAARVVTRRFDEALRPVDLTTGQYSILVALQRQRPPGIGELATELAMDRTTLTKNLKPLERRGLLTVHTDPEDSRSRILALTETGMALLADAIPLWRQAQRATLTGLAGPADLRASLRKLSFPD
ncbi:MAG: MarR family winged helix-turn-helix transcriptional regulator [Hoeflea sp.]|nr:MarR family winged helix-turn-helix transcriptional regulator [Hoeflea sp.]